MCGLREIAGLFLTYVVVDTSLWQKSVHLTQMASLVLTHAVVDTSFHA